MSDSIHYNQGSCPGVFFAILSLPAIFIMTLIIGYVGFLPLKIGLHTLVTLIIIFVIFLFFIRHNASYAACLLSKNFGLMELDLQDALKNSALTIMGKTKSTLTVRDFMEEYFKDIRDDNYAKVASMIFPMLGILGTFIAITVSMPDFTVTSGEKLDAQISLLLSGIGTAFYASIFGIFLSLWWIFFERRGLAKIEKEIISLEKLYGSRIWKKSELIKHQHMETELRDQKIVNTLEEIFNINFIKELNEQHMTNYRQIIEDTTNSFAMMATRMQEASDDLRETLLQIETKREYVKADESLRRNMEVFTHTAKELERGLIRFDNSVNYTFEKIDDELAMAVDKLSRMMELIARREIERKKRASRVNQDSYDMRER